MYTINIFPEKHKKGHREENENETKRGRGAQFIHCSKAFSGWGWSGPRLGLRDSILVSHTYAWYELNYLMDHQCLLGSILAGSQNTIFNQSTPMWDTGFSTARQPPTVLEFSIIQCSQIPLEESHKRRYSFLLFLLCLFLFVLLLFF